MEENIKIYTDIGLKFNLNIVDTAILSYILDIYKNSEFPSLLFIDSLYIIKALPLCGINEIQVMNGRLCHIRDATNLFDLQLSDIEAYELIQSTRTKNNNHFRKICQWCGVSVLSLDKHHYPIRNKDGGKEVVCICRNCHGLFHDLTDNYKVIKVNKTQYLTIEHLITI